MLRREVGQRRLHHLMPWALFGLIFSLLTSLLLEKYGSNTNEFEILGIVLFNLMPASCSALILNWFLQKQEAGALLLKVVRTGLKWLRYGGVCFWTAYAVFITWYFFHFLAQVSAERPIPFSLGLEVSIFIGGWSIAIFNFWILNLSDCELREHGICSSYTFTTWRRIKSYSWTRSHPNTLLLRLEPPRLGFIQSMYVVIPAKYQEAVSHILEQQLPDKEVSSL